MDEPTGFIYSIKNTANGKEYIGQTRHDPRKRFYVHKSTARGNSHPRNIGLLHRAMQKYGEAAFVLEVVESGVPLKWLDVRERHWIRERVTLAPCGYNQEKGGTIGTERAAHVGEAVRRAHKGKHHSLRWRENQSIALRRRNADLRAQGLKPPGGGIPSVKSTGLWRLAQRARRIPWLAGPTVGSRKGRRPMRDLIALAYGFKSWKAMVPAMAKGENHPRWKGGREASDIRYQKAHPEVRAAYLLGLRKKRLTLGYRGTGPWQKRAVLVAEMLLSA